MWNPKKPWVDKPTSKNDRKFASTSRLPQRLYVRSAAYGETPITTEQLLA